MLERPRLCACLLAGMLLIGMPAVAAREALPPAVQAGKAWRLQGEGEMRWLGLRLYHAELWVAQAQFDPAAPFALRLRYARDFAGLRLARTSVSEIQRLGERDPVRLQRWQAALEKLFPDVKEGDTLIGVMEPAGSARFFHNGEALGSLDEAELARAFFAIWLAPGTRAPELRQQLLGKAADGAN